MYKASILIVEDNKIVILELKEMLESMEYHVIETASSGEDAIAKAESVKPDLIIMDIRLKGDMDGIETSASIRKNMDVPIIFLTAHTDENTVQRAKYIEPFGYIIKPFEERELKTTIEMALYKHSIEKKLKESEERFRRTFELDSIGNSLTSVDGKFVDVNDTLCAMLGYSRDEFLCRDFTSIIFLDDIENSMQILRKLLSDEKKSYCFEERFIKKDGNIIWLNVIITLFKDSRGKPFLYFAHFIDITERKHAEIELKAQMNEINRFNMLLLGREKKMTELKKEVNALLEDAGRPKKYNVRND
ncbi:MAG: response regulator [Ignavibacteriaceae bacterium]